MQNIADNISFEPGFPELYSYLKSKNIKVAILTNGSFSPKVERLKKLGLAYENIYLVSGDIVGVEKPDLRGFLYTLEKLQVKPQETIFIGDSLYFDIEPAEKLGMVTVLFMPSYFSYSKRELIKVKNSLSNLKEVIDIVEKYLSV